MRSIKIGMPQTTDRGVEQNFEFEGRTYLVVVSEEALDDRLGNEASDVDRLNFVLKATNIASYALNRLQFGRFGTELIVTTNTLEEALQG